MKIRTRLTILFSILTATILIIFAAIIYYSARENREKEFYGLLKKEAVTKANLFFNANINAQTLQDIYRNNRETLNEVEVAIYDTLFNLMYHDAVDIDFVKETPEMIDEIYKKGEIKFYQNNWQVIGLKYYYNNKSYIVTAAAYDQYGFSKLNNLLYNIVVVFIISVMLILFAGFYFSRKALGPVKEMIDKAKVISVTNLDLRLNNYNNNKDELSELADTFNQMLARLENSFEAQKHFVSNISHELRTPLAAIIAELELSLSKERDIEAYKSAIKNVLNDAKKLARLSNSLLNLAKAEYDSAEISFKAIRIDELILDAQKDILKINEKFIVNINFDDNILNSENEILINANEYLLKTAIVNLIENACKFSKNNTCNIFIIRNLDYLSISFEDNGIGIHKNEIEKIFTPFFRGSNKNYAEGNGIGLYLTKKIVELHKGNISVSSEVNVKTQFVIQLPIA